MARRRPHRASSQHPRNHFVRAMPPHIATWPAHVPDFFIHDLPRGPVDIQTIEDRRTWEPPRYYPAPRSTRGAARIVQAGPSRAAARAGRHDPYAVASLAFQHPQAKYLAICIRRKRRRQVLLAKGYGGRNRRPRYKTYSHVRC